MTRIMNPADEAERRTNQIKMGRFCRDCSFDDVLKLSLAAAVFVFLTEMK